jgi:muramoyltetrapeptide carboxypeptidase
MLFKPCQTPPPLEPGDLLRVIAPSGTLRERQAFEAGVDIWRSQSYRVEFCSGYSDRWGYLAGSDQNRRQQLHQALADPECRGILCARGGWGSARLLEDWTWPSELEPKWLIGFSDITSLLWSLAAQGISGIHGPLLTTLSQEPDWSLRRLFHWVEGRAALPSLQGQGWGNGKAQGCLLPANLTVATHLLGTLVQPHLNGVILAFEDVSEAPYRIDRMLTQWRMGGFFSGVRGIALGRFSQCEPPPRIPSLTIDEVLRDRVGDLDIPIVSDLCFGHDGDNAALAVGLEVCLDGDEGTLSYLS